MRFHPVLSCLSLGTLGLVCTVIVVTLAQAQTTEDYFRDTPYLGVERPEDRPYGADDSTTGSVSTLDAADLSLAPNQATWTNPDTFVDFTLTNNGGMRTSGISVGAPASFTVQHNCAVLDGGGRCTIRVRPVDGSGRTGTLTAQAQFGGSVTAPLEVLEPARLEMNPASADWGEGDSAQKTFTVVNRGGQATSPLSVQLSSGAAHFNLSHNCNTLAAGANCRVQVSPKSDLVQAVTGQLRVNASSGGRVEAGLSAEAMLAPVQCDYYDGRGDTVMRAWGGHTYYSGSYGYGGSSYDASGHECNHRLASQIGTKSVRNWGECKTWCESVGAGCCTATRSARMSSYRTPGSQYPTQMVAYWNHTCIAYARNFPQEPLDNGRCPLGTERTFIYYGQGACRPTRRSSSPPFTTFYTGTITPSLTRCDSSSPIGVTYTNFQCDARLCR